LIIGCATPEAEQGMTWPALLVAPGLPVEVSAMTINRFCLLDCRPSLCRGLGDVRPRGNSYRRWDGIMSMIPWRKQSLHQSLAGQTIILTLTFLWGSRRRGWPNALASRGEQADEFSLQSHRKRWPRSSG